MRNKFSLFIAIMFLLGTLSHLSAALFWEENFDHPVGTNLTTIGWTTHSGSGTPFTVTTPGLTYTGYVNSGIGNAASTGGTSDDINKSFTSTNSGSLYLSFMYKPTSASTTTDYCVMFGATSGTNVTLFYGRLYVQKDASNNIRFGITKTSASTIQYTPYAYSLNTTYLIVIKYEFVSGTANDIARLFINPVLGGTEPTPTLSCTNDTTADPTQLVSVCLRQSTSTPAGTYDGFRVGTTWADIAPALLNPVINVNGTLAPFYTIVGQPSERQSYTLSGTDLTSNIIVTPPNGFELSVTGDEPYYPSLSLAPTFNGNIYVRFNPPSSGPYSGNITHTSGTAAQVNLPVSGEATLPSGSIEVDHTELSFVTYAGTPSIVRSYMVTGVNLTDYLYITTTAPYQIRNPNAIPPVWTDYLELPPNFDGSIEARFYPTAVGTYNNYSILHYSAGVADVSITLNGTANPPYQITVNPPQLEFNTPVGTPQVLSYRVQGTNLTENIIATAPSGFLLSIDGERVWDTTVSISNPNIEHDVFVKFNPSAVGTYSGNITNTANGITTNVAVSGTATMPTTPQTIAIGQSISQNFDVMGSFLNLPIDWKADKQTNVETRGTWDNALTVVERTGGNNMSTNASNGTYNFGAGVPATAIDRAIGFLSSGSGTKTGNLYTRIQNIGSQTITSFNISYTAEKYRQGSNPQGFGLGLYYSLDGTSWTYAGDALKATWSADANNNGYAEAPGSIQTKTGTVAINVPSNSYVYFCWSYCVLSGTTTTNAQALAVDNVSITALGNPITQAPVFNPLPGLMDGPTSVTISCPTPNATIYYTLDGQDPTTSSLVYTNPININSTATLKAIAQAPGYELSPITSGRYTIPISVPNIAALRAQPYGTGTYYKLESEAIVTLKSTTRNAKYIQDNTGAILIDDPSGIITTNFFIGDGITGLIGTLGTYANMLQFTPAKDPGDYTSTGNVVTPQVVTLSQLDTTWQGKLVQINNVTVNATGNFGIVPPNTNPTTTNYSISDPTGNGVMRVAYIDLDYVGTPIPQTPKNYVGVILEYTVGNPPVTQMQLVPRSLAEITDPVNVIPPEQVTISIIGNDVQLNWAAQTGCAYRIEYCDTPYGTYQLRGISPTNSFLAEGDAATYGKRFYRIIAIQ